MQRRPRPQPGAGLRQRRDVRGHVGGGLQGLLPRLRELRSDPIRMLGKVPGPVPELLRLLPSRDRGHGECGRAAIVPRRVPRPGASRSSPAAAASAGDGLRGWRGLHAASHGGNPTGLRPRLTHACKLLPPRSAAPPPPPPRFVRRFLKQRRLCAQAECDVSCQQVFPNFYSVCQAQIAADPNSDEFATFRQVRSSRFKS